MSELSTLVVISWGVYITPVLFDFPMIKAYDIEVGHYKEWNEYL